MDQKKHGFVKWLLAIGLALLSLTFIVQFMLVNPDRAAYRTSAAVAATADFQNCRFGVGVALNSITTYNYTPTRAGWYINWGTGTQPPSGMEFYHTIRLKQNKLGATYLPTYVITPALSSGPGGLEPFVQANPGGVWLIGNEQERSYYQDETLPDMYAQIYHDAYTFIKGIDPTAKVAIGGVIQPTPLRLQYLDKVLAAYQLKFGMSMPIDIWNIHLYILQEVAGSWGASIPVGISATVGMVYTPPQSLDLGIFSSLVRDMRTWMKSRGYQNKPLIVTEYGVLFPMWLLNDQYGLTQADINQFINDSTNYLNTAVDVDLGYPADGYRLVQQAAFYSLDDDSRDDQGDYRWGSFIFNSTPPYTLTAAGVQFINTMEDMPASVDLLPVSASTEPATLLVQNAEPITATLNVMIANAGNSRQTSLIRVRFWDITSGGQVQLQPDSVLTSMINGCGTTQAVTTSVPNLVAGAHTIRVEVDPDQQIPEASELNNLLTVTILVGTHSLYLPFVLR